MKKMMLFAVMVMAVVTFAADLKPMVSQVATLVKAKQYDAAQQFIESALQTTGLTVKEQRSLLNSFAGNFLWTPKYSYALELLQRAEQLAVPANDKENFLTYYYMGTIYVSKLRDYDKGVQVMLPLMQTKGLHPSYRYQGWYLIGSAYERNGNQAKALEAYKNALNFAKTITYKYDYSACEKKIATLESGAQ